MRAPPLIECRCPLPRARDPLSLRYLSLLLPPLSCRDPINAARRILIRELLGDSFLPGKVSASMIENQSPAHTVFLQVHPIKFLNRFARAALRHKEIVSMHVHMSRRF